MFWITPYDKITSQTAKVLRGSIVLPHENNSREHVVAAHHHQADYFRGERKGETCEFSSYEGMTVKITNTLWESPFVVTTAVQFFESMASNRPGRVRKLNKVPGSVIVIDESDACVPPHLLKRALCWLKRLVNYWNCTVIFLSGTMFRFWEMEDFKNVLVGQEPVCVVGEETRCRMKKIEDGRIEYIWQPRPVEIKELCHRVTKTPGPRVVVMNTVTNAAYAAEEMESLIGAENVVHISTAICPKTRDKMLDGVQDRLREVREGRDDGNFVLVATSCIESGVDMSFRTGFREIGSVASVFQLAGRVNRSCEYDDSKMYIFQLEGEGTTINPTQSVAKEVLRMNFDSGNFDYRCCSDAMRRELLMTMKHIVEEKKDVWYLEEVGDMHGVCTHFQIIEGKTYAVVIDPETKERLLRGDELSYQEIEHGSVQIYESKIKKDAYAINLHICTAEELNVLRPVGSVQIRNDIMVWNGAYSEKYGYMEQFLKNSNRT